MLQTLSRQRKRAAKSELNRGSCMWSRRLKLIGFGLLIVIVTAVTVAALPTIKSFLAAEIAAASTSPRKDPVPAELIRDKSGHEGLRLTSEVVKGLRIEPREVLAAVKPRALPPQVGTLNYDNERLFLIKSRFPGEVAEIQQTRETSSLVPTQFRPIRYGDKIKQAELLAVVWSRDLGEKKAALVDALSALNFSREMLKRQADLFKIGAISEATYRATERQVRQDSTNVLTAERTLKMWKLTDGEINAVKEEAKKIIELLKGGKQRDPEKEKNWARVEIKAPVFSEIADPDDPEKIVPNPSQLVTIVEKNTNKNDMVDQSTVMFKLADMSRLQIWVNVHEEFLTRLRGGKAEGQTKFKWTIQVEGASEPMELPISQVATSIDPNNHTFLVMGYLPNPDHKYRAGQFVTATIYAEPDRDTVEIPTAALNEVESEALVFVQPDPAKPEYMLRRVSVVHRFKDATFIRSELTEQDNKNSAAEVKRGKHPIEPLRPGERVVTRGVVELTSALDDLVNKDRIRK
jgi:membrane fusion protein, heavy metal efflux system